MTASIHFSAAIRNRLLIATMPTQIKSMYTAARAVSLINSYESDLKSLSSLSIWRFRNRYSSKSFRPGYDLKEKGEKYSRATGVELKFDEESEEDVDLEGDVDLTNLPLLVKRCMLRYPSTVPADLSIKRLKQLLADLPGYRENDCSQAAYEDFIKAWHDEYTRNLDEIMFKNLSSYEP